MRPQKQNFTSYHVIDFKLIKTFCIQKNSYRNIAFHLEVGEW